MEKCRESTIHGKEQLFWMVLAIAALAGWLVYEIMLRMAGRGTYTTIIYIACLAGVLIWRYAVRYTYILTNSELVVVSSLFGYSRQISVSLSQVESFSNQFVKQFFRRTKISHYIYRYSSTDPRTTRIFVFNKNGKLHGLLFKVSDAFIEEMRAMMPNNFLDLTTEKK